MTEPNKRHERENEQRAICNTQYVDKLKGEVVIVCQGDDVYEYWREEV